MGLPQNYALPTMDDDTKVNIPFPAATKQAAAEINGVKTDVMSVSFADKIMITITQGGRIAQWVTVPLLSDNPTQSDPYFQTLNPEEDGLLPAARFQPRTLLGAGGPDRRSLAHARTWSCQGGL
ncbi:hypothetical protein B0A52_03416 [Exophiala mesophila]|uniref:Proteasome assembly chaperone 3 n=1 Tax=Exophiala mesophila TaxID=212818 RepID=A0A438N682_EXOME|nr:hypothetical protein B0A52_03416 [Exophiala mesophila]